MSEEVKKNGRPTDYTEELADEICAAIAESHRGLPHLCAVHPNWPKRQVIHEWLNRHPSFNDKYLRAKYIQSEFVEDHMIDVAEACDKDTYHRAKLIVNTLQWQQARLAPKKEKSPEEVKERIKEAVENVFARDY